MSSQADLASVIEALESLTARLECAPVERLDGELQAAAGESIALLNRALPPPERDAWRDILQSALADSGGSKESKTNPEAQEDIACMPESLPCETALHGSNVARGTEDTTACDQCGNFVSSRCKDCVHGCGTRYCDAICRKKGWKRHTNECPVLKRGKLLQRMGLAGNADGEFF
jgi:hypothetical protein